MEGWDGTADGHPTELTRRRWQNFGLSGAKLVWGGEAAAVRHDGRANPCQLVIDSTTWESLAHLRDDLVAAHESSFGKGAANDLVVGLQITHSGRYARPSAWDRPEPLVAFAHPVLDRRFPGGVRILTDEDLDRLADDFVQAAVLARRAGFQFVDVKHCHGYLGHELLAAHDRPGRYGGSLENRTRFLRTVVDGDPRRGPGAARRGALLGLRHGALAEGRVRPRRARAGRRGLHVGLRPPPRRADGRGARREPGVPPPSPRPRHPLGVRERAAARTTTRTCSGPLSSRRATPTCRPRTRSPAWRARSSPRHS